MVLFLHLENCAMHNDAPPEITLIIPPHNSTDMSDAGIPVGTQINFEESMEKKQLPNNHLAQAIEAIQSDDYEEANGEVEKIQELTNYDAEAIVSFNEALNAAFEKSDDQQENIWKNIDAIGIATACGVLLDTPLKYLLPAPPETMCALYSSTTYLVYNCWRHAQRREHLDKLKTYYSNIAIIPPLYTITLPPPIKIMEYPTLITTQALYGKTHAPLERTEKSAYDGCRTRDAHKE